MTQTPERPTVAKANGTGQPPRSRKANGTGQPPKSQAAGKPTPPQAHTQPPQAHTQPPQAHKQPPQPQQLTHTQPTQPQPQLTQTPELSPIPDARYLNRELSWLDFNSRVLTLAEDPRTPLLERAKFLAIFGGNLDEFYMGRVAGLKRRMQTGLPIRSRAAQSASELLERISEVTAELVARQARCCTDEVLPLLAKENIHIVWGDSRAGFLGVWYGRVRLADFDF